MDRQVNGIAKQPVPTLASWEAVEFENGAGEKQWFVAMGLTTPLGEQTFFLPPENAKALAAGLDGVAAVAQAQQNRGLIVPGVVPPDDLLGNGHHP